MEAVESIVESSQNRWKQINLGSVCTPLYACTDTGSSTDSESMKQSERSRWGYARSLDLLPRTDTTWRKERANQTRSHVAGTLARCTDGGIRF
jgi:hypothetical protein